MSFNLDFRIDARIAAISIAIGIAATVLAGLVPALVATRSDLSTLIKGTGSLSGRRGDRLRSVLVTGQVAVSFLLVLLSTLFGVSLLNAQNQDSVLPATALAFADLSPGAFGYDAAHVQLFYGALLERARNRAGVDAAAFARHVPLNSIYGGGATQGVSIPGVEPPKGQSSLAIRQNVVSPGYFATMDIPLVGGRDFNTLDTANGAKVIINETSFRGVATAQAPHQEHPTFNAGPNSQGMQALRQFYDSVMAKKTAGTCGAPRPFPTGHFFELAKRAGADA